MTTFSELSKPIKILVAIGGIAAFAALAAQAPTSYNPEKYTTEATIARLCAPTEEHIRNLYDAARMHTNNEHDRIELTKDLIRQSIELCEYMQRPAPPLPPELTPGNSRFPRRAG